MLSRSPEGEEGRGGEWGRDVKDVSRPIKLQTHNVTVIGFNVPDVLLLPAQRLTSVPAPMAQVSSTPRPACYWLFQIAAGVKRQARRLRPILVT